MIKSSITEEHVGLRLDSFVVTKLPLLSRASVQKLIGGGQVLVNKKPAKVSYKLRLGDQVVVKYDQLEQEQIPDIVLPILYEDEDCVVIDKPVGVLSHSKGAFNPEATVATFLQQMIPELKTQVDAGREGIVHRLDRATSGVMIVAKNGEAHRWLQKQFAERKVQKTYMAIVAGQPQPETAMIDMPIERNPKKPQTFRAGSNGKPAQTAYKSIQVVKRQSSDVSLVELKPHTGRTHQLRVHLKQIGHPIIGDTLYGGEPAERLFLHALSLEITLPNGTRPTLTAPLSQVFEAFLDEKKIMNDLVLHPDVTTQLQRFAAKPSHALMLIGAEGAGKRTVAVHLATAVLGLDGLDALAKHPYYFLLEPDDGVQRIEAIRTLQDKVRLKTPGTAAIRRVIVIEAAHTMTVQAQNALLKLLEEPPADTVLMLNVVGQRSLLPTVYSRAQQIYLKPLDKQQLMQAFTLRGHNPDAIKTAYHLSGGQIGLLVALLEQDNSHPLSAAIVEAKRIFSMPRYERLAYVGTLTSQKQAIPELLQAMQRVARAALVQAGARAATREIKRWHRSVQSINQAQQAVGHNANGKLLLTDLLLGL